MVGSGEEGHCSPKYFRWLGDLGVSRTLHLGVLLPRVGAQLQSQLVKGSAELAGKEDGMGWDRGM